MAELMTLDNLQEFLLLTLTVIGSCAATVAVSLKLALWLQNLAIATPPKWDDTLMRFVVKGLQLFSKVFELLASTLSPLALRGKR